MGCRVSLTQFLHARLDEDEAASNMLLQAANGMTIHIAVGGVLIPLPNKDRLLAEVKAKRAIVTEMSYDGIGPRDWVLRQLAAPYAYHPDYDPSWLP